MNVLRFLSVAVCLCVAPGAGADDELKTNQTASRSVCVLECSIKDVTAVAKTFSRFVSEEKVRFINLTIDANTSHSNSSVCENSTVRNSTQFHAAWAPDESEPYLSLLPHPMGGFFFFASPVYFRRRRIEIDLNCSGKAREYRFVHGKVNETSLLENAVIGSLIRDLMQEKGVLCLPHWGSHSDSGRFHYCCHLNKSTSGMTCNLVQSTIYGWIYALLASVFCVIIFIALYLPAVICLPSLPRVSGGGVRCIVVEDPSPAALQSLIAKAFSRPNPASLQDKTRLFFLETTKNCLLMAASTYILGFNLSNSYTAFGVLMGLSTVETIFDIVMPCTSLPYLCGLCDGPAKSSRHWDVSDAVREHMDRQLLIIRNQCHKFCTAVITRICFRPSFESPVTAIWSVCRVFLSIVLVPFAIVGIPLGCTCFFLFIPMIFSPSGTVLTYNIYRFSSRFEEFPPHRSCLTRIGSNCIEQFLVLWDSFLMLMAFPTLYVIGVRVGFLAIAAIDFADIAFPLVAFSVLILYNVYSCFSSFSEKYQLLKIKLFQGIKEHHDNGGRLLLVFTEKGATAIPEDLFKIACKELDIPMGKTFWQGFMKMISLMAFTITVYASIQIFGSRSGTAPLTKVVVIFLAGSLPKILSVISAGGNQDKLQELDMEVRLKDVITTYANPQVTVNRGSENEEQLEVLHSTGV